MSKQCNYYCTNKDCDIKFQKQTISKEGDENEEPCPVCGQLMKFIGIQSYGGFLSFNSKSDEDKKKILKKRADDHTRTKMKDRIHHIKKKFGAI